MLLKSKKKVINLFCHRKLKISKSLNLNFKVLNISNRLFFVIYNIQLQTYKYLILPALIKITIENDNISFLFLNKKKYHLFYMTFVKYINKIQIYYKQMLLKGSGFKILFFNKTKQLELKLGFTHKKYVCLPNDKNFEIIIQKPVLILLDYNSTRLGNFIQKIKITKYPNIYSGRGFWNLKEKQKLKIIKKQ